MEGHKGKKIHLNGIEGGSKVLSGREIMDLWDRICANLRARKIAVEDASRKRSTALRLLHGVAYGHSWFGRWGYRFCRGSFGVTEKNYYEAIETLGSLKLDEIVKDLSKTKYYKEIKQIIRRYRDMSETHIITIRDLLRFMLTVKSRAAPVSKITVTSSAASSSAFISRNSTKHALSRQIKTGNSDAMQEGKQSVYRAPFVRASDAACGLPNSMYNSDALPLKSLTSFQWLSSLASQGLFNLSRKVKRETV